MDKMMFRRVPLEALLEVLEDIYEKGADYVDIVGFVEGDEHNLIVSVIKDYFPEELQGNYDIMMQEPPQEEIKFEDTDLNDII
jgi:hypothetical protein